MVYNFSVYQLVVKVPSDRGVSNKLFTFSSYKEAERYGKQLTIDNPNYTIHSIEEVRVNKL